jgi:hypothetical protein
MAVTSDVVILSRTKMAEGRVCVGAFDVRNERMLRLLDDHAGVLGPDCIYQVGETYQIRYLARYQISPPHTEDVAVYNAIKVSQDDQIDLSAVTSSLSTHHDALDSIFEGKLVWENHKGYIPGDDLVDYSVTIVTLGYDLHRDGNNYVYRKWGVPLRSVKYVGALDIDHMPDVIAAGTKIRFSLARLWDMKDDGNLRSYLQLSGIYD